MNRIDKAWYKALTFLATNKRKNVIQFMGKAPKRYKQIVPEEIEKTFIEWSYINFDNDTIYAITQSGLQQLRDLEDIRRKDRTIIISISALIISIFAFGKAMGWF